MRAAGFGTSVLLFALVLIGLQACSSTDQRQPKALDAGVPAYPGAQEVSGGFTKHLLPQDRAKLVHAVVYETEDPPEKVISFYRERLKGKSQVLETKTHGALSAAIRAEVDGQYKLLVIASNEDSGKTEIVIGNIQSPPANKGAVGRHPRMYLL